MGLIYATVAMGIMLLFSAAGVMNFAQGSLLALGAYIGWALMYRWNLPSWPVRILLMLLILIAVGAIFCSLCFLPKQTVNAAVTGFYDKGWLRMQELPEDRRNKALHLTELGRSEAGHILQNLQECDRIAMGSLTESEQEQLLSLTRRYMSACISAMKKL